MNLAFREELAAVYDSACGRISRIAERLEGGREFPHVTDDGRWRTWPADVYAGWDGDNWSHGNWTCGFWVGLLWLAFLRTREPRFRLHVCISRLPMFLSNGWNSYWVGDYLL